MKCSGLLGVVFAGFGIMAAALAFAENIEEVKHFVIGGGDTSLGSYQTNNPIREFPTGSLICVPNNMYLWKERTIVPDKSMTKFDKKAATMWLSYESDGTAQLSGGSRDDYGTWNEQYRTVQADEMKMHFTQPDTNLEPIDIKLVRISVEQFKFVRFGGDELFLQTGICTKQSS